MERESISLEHVSEACTCIGRRCTTCKHLLCFGRFVKKPTGAYGLASRCQDCANKSLAEWREKKKAGFAPRKDFHYWSFEHARAFVRELGLKTRDEWIAYCRSDQKPVHIPTAAWNVYKQEWQGLADWLGPHVKYWPFEQARAFVWTLEIKTEKEWIAYYQSGMKPDYIPACPYQVYAQEWQGYGDWFGTGALSRLLRDCLPFEQARAFVHTLELKGTKEWYAYCHSGQKPAYLPVSPEQVYAQEWKGFGDWLGTDTIAPFNRVFLPFEQARSFVQSLALSNGVEWCHYCRSGARPSNIPAAPNVVYWKEWEGMGDWLGTGRPRAFRRGRVFWPFNQARAYVQSLGIKNQKAWKSYCRSGQKPVHIPATPDYVYAKEWKGFGDWLGTGNIATHRRKFWAFEQARTFVQKRGLKGSGEWERYRRTGALPTHIPCRPDMTYKAVWKGMDDWLGKRRAMAEKTALQPRETALRDCDG